MAKFNTIDDFDVNGKTVLMRIDINSPVDPNSGIILDDTRMKIHAETIKELSLKGAKTVLLAHQSRPGKNDFTTFKQHAEVLSKAVGMDVKYVDSIFSSTAKEAILALEPGQILLLENVRFYSEEQLKRSPEEEATSVLVKSLSPLIDYFINDAFAAAHRSQTSLVGFTTVVPSAAGRVMEKELTVIGNALENVQHPCVFALGGMKADDSIMVTENVLENGTADYVLVSGLVANIFIWAAGYDIKSTNENFIEARGYLDMVDKCRDLIKRFPGKIIYPQDVAVSVLGDRADVTIENIPDASIFDIGRQSLIEYSKIIREAKTIFANGPAGVFEDPKFAIGTEDIINAIASSEGFSIIGGGHIAAACVNLGYGDKMDHISSGGGASINMLAGKPLAAVQALEASAELFNNKE
ncbi:phosphoglycerate kinase Pgk [Methanobrevibacter ruminantium M1]|uniref:Phosphoglycerate kinase n=1 Tax=Methanobrevibacter ruminantium (strain ATCC 35063 / DSM 1093 / JCM 13430 / OCM 146 / M1) TaxID=634498 RepID=D3DZJ3_METRM|nr:phosphoglycerate kinase [Methanobrevibacter ruminantium]ADC47671.1 phosphoglycerate kinase Pgk [Methanobrevibacter ruminantium M1]